MPAHGVLSILRSVILKYLIDISRRLGIYGCNGRKLRTAAGRVHASRKVEDALTKEDQR